MLGFPEHSGLGADILARLIRNVMSFGQIFDIVRAAQAKPLRAD
jgi:hypothetical protein